MIWKNDASVEVEIKVKVEVEGLSWYHGNNIQQAATSNIEYRATYARTATNIIHKQHEDRFVFWFV